MAPVFTPFDLDEGVHYEMIDPYAKLLKSKKINAVLVNGTTGEGTSLNLAERKKTTEKWKEACEKYEMLLMVQIAGGPMADTIALARHCSDLKVDGVLCLPELYHKPKTIEKLLDYICDISFHCSNIPIYYYHIPMLTNVNLPMDAFMELASRQLPAFAGIKYTSGDMEMGVKCLQYGQVFLGSDTILAGAIALGFDCFIMTTVNIKPEFSLSIIELMEEGKVKEAREQQMKLNDFVKKALDLGKAVSV